MKKIDLFKDAQVISRTTQNLIAIGGASQNNDDGESFVQDNGDSQYYDNGGDSISYDSGNGSSVSYDEGNSVEQDNGPVNPANPIPGFR